MITHIAVFKWRSNVKKADVDEALLNVSNLKTKIPGIIDIRCDENFSKHNKGFTHAVVVTAKNNSALQAYREHPEHKIVADKIEKMEEDGIGVDFESD